MKFSIKMVSILALGVCPLLGFTAEPDDSNTVFDWAESSYPELFSPAGTSTNLISGYWARYYSDTDVYLGSKEGTIYVYGSQFTPNLLEVGTVVEYLALATEGDDEDESPDTEEPLLEPRMVDTGQTSCYSDTAETSCPTSDQSYFGQDAQYEGPQPSYADNGDGTVTDNRTGLTWQKSVGDKTTLSQALATAETLVLGDKSDWRVPTIKELYTLINFNGYTGSGSPTSSSVPSNAVPFIDTEYFDFEYGDTSAGERYIDAQWLSSTTYVSTTMLGDNTLFGVNFADGRIKGYGYSNNSRPQQTEKTFFVRYVRGEAFGNNQFIDNGDNTITDQSSSQMWTKLDSGGYNAGNNQDGSMDWPTALAWCENLDEAGHQDWRLPNSKELQYIVDYSRSPATTQSPAIDPIFESTAITDEKSETNYPFYWTSTTHLDGPTPGNFAAYIAFGEALGVMDFGSGEQVFRCTWRRLSEKRSKNRRSLFRNY